MTPLEKQFHEAMINIYDQALKECDYRATRFLAMVNDMGGLSAAKRLLASSEPQSGLYELFECDRLDLAVEELVLKQDYQALFTPEELAEARRRLDELQRKTD